MLKGGALIIHSSSDTNDPWRDDPNIRHPLDQPAKRLDSTEIVNQSDMITVLDRLSHHLNRDRDSLCLGLILINNFIKELYNEITVTMSNFIASIMKDDATNMFHDVMWFSRRNSMISVAQNCTLFLKGVITNFEDHKLEKFEGKLDIEKIKEIIRNIDSFIEETSNSRTIYLGFVERKAPQEELFEFVRSLLTNLNKYTTNITILTFELKIQLGCMRTELVNK